MDGGGVPVCDIRLDETEHLLGGLGHLDEDAVVDLEEAQELKDLAGLWGDLVDTIQAHQTMEGCRHGSDAPPDPHDEVDLGLCRDVVVSRGTRDPLQADLLALLVAVLFHKRLSTFEYDLALRFLGLCGQTKTLSVTVHKMWDR